MNAEGFSNYISSIDWEERAEHTDVDEYWNLIKDTIDTAVSDFVPVKPRNPACLPWSNPYIKRLVKIKQRRWSTYIKYRSEENFSLYKKAMKTCSRAVRKSVRNYEKKLAENKSTKPFYAYIKSKTKSNTSVGPIKEDGKALNDKDAGNALNTFFANIFCQEDISNLPDGPVLHFDNELTNIEFKHSDIVKKIDKLKPHSAPGPDGIRANVLKDFKWELARPLQLMFRKSLDAAAVPGSWKQGNITPVHKKGSRSLKSNYRPISLTSLVCKIMEGIIKDSIVTHLSRNNLLEPTQHGFTNRKSCLTNLLVFLESVTSDMDSNTPVDTIYLDFSKAFDLVPKERLLKKLEGHGIRDNLLKWSRDWLTDRTQRVVLNGQVSKWEPVLSGVPQGSVLGPLFFIKFNNDIDLAANRIDLILKFADDTKIKHAIRTPEDQVRLQECLDNLYDWSLTWGMRFNLDKCVVLHHGRENPKYNYTMNNKSLPTITEEKDLGVITQANLKPRKQCLASVKKANFALGQIMRTFKFRDRQTFLKLYKQHVRCHLEYCIQAWRPWHVQDIEALEKVQKRAVKQIRGLEGVSYEEKLLELGLNSLERRRDYFDLVETYKIINNHYSGIDKSVFFKTTDQSDRVTRLTSYPNNLLHQRFQSDIRKNFFSIRVTNSWNNLPDVIKDAPTIDSFKTNLKKLML